MKLATVIAVFLANCCLASGRKKQHIAKADGFIYQSQLPIAKVSDVRTAFYEVCPLANFTNLPSMTSFTKIFVGQNSSEPFRVTAMLTLTLSRFIGINDLEQSMSLFVDAFFQWNLPCDVPKFCQSLVERNALDKCLADNCSKNFEIFKFRRPTAEVWIPAVSHMNTVSKPLEMMSTIIGGTVLVYPFQPSAMWISDFRMDTACEGFSFAKFPFDTLACNVTFESFDPLELVDFQFADVSIPGGHETFVSATDVWQLVTSPDELKPYVGTNVYDTDETYAVMTFELKFRRKYQYYMTTVILPVYGMFLLQLAALMLSPKLPDRPAFAMAVVLAFAFLLSIVFSNIPATSEIVYLSFMVSFKFYWGVAITIYAIYTSAATKTMKPRRIKLTPLNRDISLNRFLDIIVTAVELLSVLICDATFFSLMANN